MFIGRFKFVEDGLFVVASEDGDRGCLLILVAVEGEGVLGKDTELLFLLLHFNKLLLL